MTTTSTSLRTTLALIAGTTLLAQSAKAQAGSYTIIDIGDLAPAGESDGTNATGMNELGHVAAVTGDGSGPHGTIPVLYRDGQLLNLGAFPGSLVGGGSKGVNNLDQVSGWAIAPYPSGGYQSEPFVWTEDEGMFNPIDGEPVNYSGEAWDVNDAGQVVFTSRGGFYDATTGFKLLSFPGGGNTWKAWDLNEDGVVAGSAFGPTNQINAFRYDSATDTIVNLNDPALDYLSDAYGINDRGDIAGWSHELDLDRPAIVWTREGKTLRFPLGGLGPNQNVGEAEHINNHGDVVGLDSFVGPSGGDPDFQPIGWVAFGATDGSAIVKHDLLDLLDPETALPWQRLHPFEINDRGEICGIAVYHGGTAARGFLMVPTTPDHFRSLSGATPGVEGRPILTGKGTLEIGTGMELSLANARPNAQAHLLWSVSTVTPAPMGGLLAGRLTGYPRTSRTYTTDSRGNVDVQMIWPAGFGSGPRIEAQFLVTDPAAPSGFSASNVVTQTTH